MLLLEGRIRENAYYKKYSYLLVLQIVEFMASNRIVVVKDDEFPLMGVQKLELIDGGIDYGGEV